MPAHKALERSRLVRREVIDVCLRVAHPGLSRQIDESFEGSTLILKGFRPERSVGGLAVEAACHVAEKVLAHAFLGEVVAFKVEKDVIGGGFGQERKAMLGVEGLL